MVEKVQMIGTAFLPIDKTIYLNNLMYITVAYYGEITEEPVFNKDEISEIKWISKEELDNFEFCPCDVELLKLGFDLIGKD